MSRVGLCPRCKQPLPSSSREGIYLPAKKAAIYDCISNHPGITIEEIIGHLDDDAISANTIRQHIYQINNMMAATDVQIISGDGVGQRGCYRIVRTEIAA
jgi:hypothetical protein